MALITPDVIEAWNQVVTTRRLYFILDYTSHSPVFSIGAPDVNPEPLFLIDTRKKTIIQTTLKSEALQIAMRDLIDKFEKIGVKMVIGHEQNKGGQKFASLRIKSLTGGPMDTVMHKVKKGTKHTYTTFALTDRW